MSRILSSDFNFTLVSFCIGLYLVRTPIQSHPLLILPLAISNTRPRQSRATCPFSYFTRAPSFHLFLPQSYLIPRSLHRARVPALGLDPSFLFFRTPSRPISTNVDLSHPVEPGSWDQTDLSLKISSIVPVDEKHGGKLFFPDATPTPQFSLLGRFLLLEGLLSCL